MTLDRPNFPGSPANHTVHRGHLHTIKLRHTFITPRSHRKKAEEKKSIRFK